MRYTVRFAHLAEAPLYKVGDTIIRGQSIGVMGNTGKSTGPHVHLDVVEGSHPYKYTLAEIENGNPPAARPRQALYFIDKELFGVEPVVTTHYADPDYFATFSKIHLGYDVVPEDRHSTKEHFIIHWPRSMPGKVSWIDNDPAGYGHCIYVEFDAP